ncbi:MAG: galactokinase [Runella sp.]
MSLAYPERVVVAFQKKFAPSPTLIVRAPGRINLIGEHTDYNEGFVLPAAIDKAIYFAINPRSDRRCKFYATNLRDSHEISLDHLKPSSKSWVNYLVGVMSELEAAGYRLPTGFEVAFGGNIPHGAGLSSSAAVESGMGFALSQLFDFEVSKMNLALIAQRAEHRFAGVQCGIMDMFASLHGRAQSVIRLDCRDLSYSYFPFDFADYELILCNSGVKHSLADSAYNTRRQECEQGVRILQELYPHIRSLRDLTPQQIETHRDILPTNVYRRCHYVTSEIARVVAACQDLEARNLDAFGQKMYETHQGLSQDYEVSCDELDFLVSQTYDLPEVIGARLVGGGFGGCTLNIVRKEVAADFQKKMQKAYQKQFGRNLDCYPVTLTDGVGQIKNVSPSLL